MTSRDVLRVTLDYQDIHWLFTPPPLSPFSSDFHEYSTTAGVEFIVNELYANSSLKRVETTILLPSEQITPDLEEQTRWAVQRYCRARSHEMEQEERALRWRTMRSLGLAVIALLILVGISQPLTDSGSFPLRVLGEGLYLFGWVALWFPLDALIFGARHHQLDADLYRRAMEMKLVIRDKLGG